MTNEAQAVDVDTLWREHCRNAVRKFVMHAVVIDNQPVLERVEEIKFFAGESATIVDEGMGDNLPELTAEVSEETGDGAKSSTEEAESEDEAIAEERKRDKAGAGEGIILAHNLNVRELSDAFAEEEIACAFVFPEDKDTDEEKIFRRVMLASMPADIVVIDWYLRDTNPNLTKRILKTIAEKDHAEKGRLRLICVYTGQTNTDVVTRDAVAELTAGGLISNKIDEKGGLASGKHHCLLVLNKQDVHGAALPTRILEAFTALSDGILPSFALAAVAAIRRNVHHIITRFSCDLDAAFVTNRLITDPPSDVSELIRELFVSECDAALGLDKVADNYLERDSIALWLDVKGQPKGQFAYNSYSIDRAFINGLLQDGIKEGKIKVGDVEKKFPEDKRVLLSHALHGTEFEAKTGECKFSRHIALKREAFGMSKLHSDEGWVPSLTLGTILRRTETEDGKTTKRYFYCLTPACDTLRLNDEERMFLMIEIDVSQGKTNLIIAEEGGIHTALHIVPHPRKVRTFKFRGDGKTGRVLARSPVEGEADMPIYYFDSTPEQFVWLGEVRRNRANRDMADLNREWLRFGIHDSELLRIAGKTKVKILGN
ncbi:MAG: response regulator receiver domain [Syntrophales bacterium]|nr:response regulator receiver domain [Syntrophales bacterium]